MSRSQVIDGTKVFKPIMLAFSNALLQDTLQRIARSTVGLARREINRGGRFGRMRSDGQRASVEGEAPYNLTGELNASLAVRELNLGTVSIGSTVDYARTHEFGARPFLKPQIPKAIANEVDSLQFVVQVR